MQLQCQFLCISDGSSREFWVGRQPHTSRDQQRWVIKYKVKHNTSVSFSFLTTHTTNFSLHTQHALCRSDRACPVNGVRVCPSLMLELSAKLESCKTFYGSLESLAKVLNGCSLCGHELEMSSIFVAANKKHFEAGRKVSRRSRPSPTCSWSASGPWTSAGAGKTDCRSSRNKRLLWSQF